MFKKHKKNYEMTVEELLKEKGKNKVVIFMITIINIIIFFVLLFFVLLYLSLYLTIKMILLDDISVAIRLAIMGLIGIIIMSIGYIGGLVTVMGLNNESNSIDLLIYMKNKEQG